MIFLCSCGVTQVADCRVTGQGANEVLATATIKNYSLKRIVRSQIRFATNGNGKIGSITDYTFDKFVPIGASAKATKLETIAREVRPTWEHLGSVTRCQPLHVVYEDGSVWDPALTN